MLLCLPRGGRVQQLGHSVSATAVLLWGDFPAECVVRRAVYHIRPQTLPHRDLGIMAAFALFTHSAVKR